jgi:hypothetical protein
MFRSDTPATEAAVELQTALLYLPFLACVFCLCGVIAVSRWPDSPYAVPLARAVLLTGAGFMLWLGWMAYSDGPSDPLINWACVVICPVSALVIGGAALISSGQKVLSFIEQIRNGF